MAATLSIDNVTTSAPYTGLDQQEIGGQWRTGRSARKLLDKNPYSGEVLAEITQASRDDVDAAFAAAEKSEPAWGATLPEVRASLMRRVAAILDARAEEFISWIVRESGSTRFKAGHEVGAARAMVLEASSFPTRLEGRILASSIPGEESRVYREPLGVIGVISPWNAPLLLSMRSVAPALALGNTVVLKPASDTPVTGGLLIAKIFEEAGVPPGVLNVVVGAGSEIGDYFVEHRVPRLISFTGSTEVGRGVGRLATGGRYIKRIALELGGNAPLVVLDDAALEEAAQAAVFGRFLHQGQICMSTNRVIVDAAVHDRFVNALADRVRTLKVGDPNDPQTFIGPIINATQLEGLVQKIARAKRDGAHQIIGGDPEGNLIPPHLFTEVDPSWSIALDESFGPLLPIIKARDEAHALELANATDYGLSSAVFTRDLERGVRFARGIVAGMAHINGITIEDQFNAPFGGEKNSGLGRFNGDWIIDEFTRTHWITLQHQPRPYPV